MNQYIVKRKIILLKKRNELLDRIDKTHYSSISNLYLFNQISEITIRLDELNNLEQRGNEI